ncbi:MAG: hydroxyacid dehydrogenase [Bacteroidales bacterium]|jgi:D-3-phosphoglycerate dehydrogenase|nr:hydroxyacid dehydrogenase [Bacteroidales bacterium]
MNITAVEPIGITDKQNLEFTKMFAELGHTFRLFDDRKEDENTLISRMKDADIAIISNIPLSAAVLSQCPNLKLLSVAFTGLDHIDLAYCNERKIDVINASGYSTTAVAELAVGLMIDACRKISEMDAQTRIGGTRGSFLGRQLRGKTIGIAGTGAIGLETARILSFMGCKIIAYSRSVKQEALQMGIRYVGIDDLMRQSDVISLHLPLTPDTNQIISRQKLALCKPTSIIINTARGKIIDNVALAEALRDNKIAGAAIDVFESEPPLTNHPLLAAPHCILTPHIAFATEESFSARIDIVISNIKRWLQAL